MAVRTFIALPVSDPLSSELGDVSAQLAYQDKRNSVRWVDEQKYHVTLAFLGDTTQSEIDVVADHLAEQLESDAVQLQVSYLSPFPQSKPKLIAVLLDKTPELIVLHQQVNKALRLSNMAVEKRKFNPHITLGRYRSSWRRAPVIALAGLQYQCEVDSVIFYQSTLTPSGAEYDPLYEFSLG